MGFNKKYYFFLIIILLITFLSCKEATRYEPYNSAFKRTENHLKNVEEKEKVIKIGFAIPITGELSNYGLSVYNGGLIAIKEINESTTKKKETDDNNDIGSFKYLINTIIEDTATNEEQGLAVAEKLAFIDNVNIIIGEYSNAVTMKMADVCKKANVPMISPMSTAPEITLLDDNDTVFRVVPSDDLQGRFLAETSYNDKGYRYVAIIHQNSSYGNSLANSFSETFNNFGGLCSLFSYNPQRIELSREINAIIEFVSKYSPEEAILLIGYPDDAKTILNMLYEKKIKTKFFFSDGAQSSEVFNVVDSSFVEGSWGAGFTVFKSPYEKEFRKKYRELFKEDPILYAMSMYDATAIAILSIVKANDLNNKEAIKEAIREVTNSPGEIINAGELLKGIKLLNEGKDINYVGLTNDIEFDENGDTSYNFSIWKVNNSKIIY